VRWEVVGEEMGDGCAWCSLACCVGNPRDCKDPLKIACTYSLENTTLVEVLHQSDQPRLRDLLCHGVSLDSLDLRESLFLL